MTQVTAAIIRRCDRVLICQRPVNKCDPLLWEFPGGKLEKGETLEQCLVRECQEELGVVLSVGKKFGESTYTYPDIAVHLTFFEAIIIDGAPTCKEHNDIKWVTKDELTKYVFCPADKDIVKKLTR